MKFRGRAARLEVNPMGGEVPSTEHCSGCRGYIQRREGRPTRWKPGSKSPDGREIPGQIRRRAWMVAKGSLFPRRLESQNSRLSTTSIEASTIRAATAKLARIPGHGRCFPRRKVFLSIEKSPVTSRQALKRGIQLSNTNTERSTTPNATAGAVYSPTTNDETKTAIAK